MVLCPGRVLATLPCESPFSYWKCWVTQVLSVFIDSTTQNEYFC